MKTAIPYKGLCISACQGGGGKTLLSLGLGRALARRNHVVKAFKKGPDYIDSAWLSLACGQAATNLDPFFLPPQQLTRLFHASLAALDVAEKKGLFALLEGNRGLYDGLDAKGSCSTAKLARLLKLPILLNLNCEKCTRTISAIIRGLTTFEENLTFCGLILNRVGSPRHARALREAIEQDTDLKILGILPRLSENPLPERHMGLASRGSDLAVNADSVINKLADLIEENCDLDELQAALPSQAPPSEYPSSECMDREKSIPSPDIISNSNAIINEPRVTIGYVRDAAFWFYYPENLQALREAGAELVPLKIIDAAREELPLWEKLDALYLGGGFPEDFPAELESSPLLKKIASLANDDMPIYAECGGMMLLCKRLFTNGREWRMSGIFDHDIEWHKKPQGLGYVEGVVERDNPYFPAGQIIKGHEFHYSRYIPQGKEQAYALRLSRGIGLSKNLISASGGRDALLYKNVWASYTHIFAPALPCWATNFVQAARKWKEKRRKNK